VVAVAVKRLMAISLVFMVVLRYKVR